MKNLYDQNKKQEKIYLSEMGRYVACTNKNLAPSLEILNARKKITPSQIQKGIERICKVENTK